jgi:menaquinone-dependent protoporphyrinogen oxidase
MAGKILVAYASKHGATADIAEKIGQLLSQEDLDADVMPANQVVDVTQYDAFIIGSASYIGQWRKEASKFLGTNEKLIAGRPVWLFSSGPTGEGDAVELMKGWRFPERLQPIIDRIKPRDIAIFHGSIDIKKLSFFEKLIVRAVKAPIGDFRDWDSITSWTKSIAGELKKQG